MKLRIPLFQAPYRLAIIHTILILLFMFTYSQRLFLPDPQMECIYEPYGWVSGPLVYDFMAHPIQHLAEDHLPPGTGVVVAWGIVPGIVCLVFGGLQWWGIELFGLKIIRKLKRSRSVSNKQLEVIVANAPKPHL